MKLSEIDYDLFIRAYEIQSRRQLTERDEIEQSTEPLEYRRQVVERFRAKMAAAGMPIGRDRQNMPTPKSTWMRYTDEELQAIYSKPKAQDGTEVPDLKDPYAENDEPRNSD